MTMSVGAMAAKKRCFDVIERFPAEQLSSLADSLEAMYKMIDEAADDVFCIALAERHANREDKDEPGIPLEDLAAELGIVLGEDDEN